MEKIYKQADDVNVAAVFVYGTIDSAEGNVLYGDPKYTEYLDPEIVYRAFLSGALLIWISGIFMRPLGYRVVEDSKGVEHFLYATLNVKDGIVFWAIAEEPNAGDDSGDDSGDGGGK